MAANLDSGADPGKALLARIDRLESLDAIRQLAARYCLALDMRALDSLVNLFPADVRVSRHSYGRIALRRWFDETLRVQFTGTAHVTGNHIIEFDDPDHAHGIVYSRNEHETGSQWVIMTMMYWDHYTRIDGSWFFRRRLPLYWYATDLNAPPVGDHKMRWPDREHYDGGWGDFWPTWKQFWDAAHDLDSPVAEPAPIDEFLTTMRQGGEAFSVRVR